VKRVVEQVTVEQEEAGSRVCESKEAHPGDLRYASRGQAGM